MRGFLLAYKSLCFFLPAILIVHPISLGYLELMENERFCALFTMFDVLSSQSFHLVKESRFVLQMTISSSWLNWVKQHLFRWVWYCSFSQFRLVDTSLIFQPSLLQGLSYMFVQEVRIGSHCHQLQVVSECYNTDVYKPYACRLWMV